MITVEIRRTLLEFGEILDRAQRALGAMDLLVEQATQADRVNAETSILRPCIRIQVKGGIGVEVGMAIKAGYAELWFRHLAVVRLVELFLRERRQQQP